ncbi:MAG TPA: hypothetical protein VJN41_08345 [Alphaproteobacteria bacterium]|nr:hypothetical protein [Alphaproteobacteria bacterium]
MTDANYLLSADDDADDLPRTLRREREARAREARERAAAGPPQFLARDDDYDAEPLAGEPVPAVVTRFDVPFFRLMTFFMKAVLAAIPALILLGVILWFAGDLLQALYPKLVKMRIMIHFPNG